MSKAGQSNYKGINGQAFAALSLFLQNLMRSDFKEMILEGENLEDFVLVYNNGKKIICESKIREKGIFFSELKNILDVVISNKQLAEKDELLIISNKINNNVKSLVKNFVFWSEKDLDKLKTQAPHFKDINFRTIPHVKLWEISQSTNEKGILFLMHQVLSGDNPFWIPKAKLQRLVDSLLINDIYKNSQIGKKITKKDFLDKLETIKAEYIEDGGAEYEKIKMNNLDEIEKVVKLVTENNPSKRDICANAITELTTNPSLHYELLRRLSLSKNLILNNWKVLWLASINSAYSFEIFKIFQNNISSSENQKFVINFINQILEEYLVNYHREDFIKNEITDICKKILDSSSNFTTQIFSITQKLFEYSSKTFFYHENNYRDKTWSREQIADFLKKLYDHPNTKIHLKKQIIKFIFSSFNLVDDNSKYWHFTPPSIFSIISTYVNKKPEKYILEFAKIASEQYQKSLRKYGEKIKFEGWEHMGGGISQSGSHFSIEDRHFITNILEPALEIIPNNNEKWSFVVNNLITTDLKKINAKHPDFLNRASISYLFDQYEKGRYQLDSLDILGNFIKMKKGIPWKPDIIFQELKSRNLPINKQWSLIQISLDEYSNLPVNVFVEQMVTEIAQDNNSAKYQQKAIDILISWSKDPKYRSSRSMGSYDLIDSVFRLLNNTKTFDYGVLILETHIKSNDFKKLENTYGSWDIGKALALVISKNVKKGLKILQSIEDNKILGINQQLVLLGSLDDLKLAKNNVLLNVYKEFVKPLLRKYSDKKSLELRFSHSYAREGLVKFSGILAKAQYFEQSLEILKRFVEDSDPTLEEHDDNVDEHNLHQKVILGEDMFAITSVRGNVAMVLRHFSLLPARDYFAKAVPLLKTLSEDKNYYIRVQATYPLMEFMKNRDTYILDNKQKRRFIDETTSNNIEKIAFSMLNNDENHKLPAVLKGLVHVFSSYRYMSHKQALEVLTILLSSDSEDVLSDTTSLLLFFAEFRENSYKKWEWGKLPKFNSTSFKKIINQHIESGDPNIRRSLSWEFWRLPKEGQKTADYYNKKLFKKSHNYFSHFTKYEYEKSIWGNIYHFIEDYLEYEPDSCINLWKACVLKERPYFIEAIKDKDSFHDLYWRPFFYNGKVLVSILKNLGTEEFVKWMEYLIDYPPKLLIANDIEVAVSELSKLPKSIKGVDRIFDKLVNRYPKYFDIRSKWINSNK